MGAVVWAVMPSRDDDKAAASSRGLGRRVDERYRTTGALHLRGALQPELLHALQRRLADVTWQADTYTGHDFAFDTATVDLPELDAFLALDPLDLRGRVGLPTHATFAGALKRLAPGPNYRFPWHRDHRHGRLVGMSINLSPGQVYGGRFEQRLRWHPEPTVSIDSQAGDVHLFDVSDARLVHRVTPIEAGVRVVVAGWWTATPL